MPTGQPDFTRLIRVDLRTRQVIKPELAFIPAIYFDYTARDTYSREAGGDVEIVDSSLTGARWRPLYAGAWIEFDFYGTSVGVVFGLRAGEVDIYVDGEFVQTLDVTTVPGYKYNPCHMVSEELEDKLHTIRIVAKTTNVRIVGIVADARKNYGIVRQWPYERDYWLYHTMVQLHDEPYLYTTPDHFYSQPWSNASVSAGATSYELAIYRMRHFTVHVEVNAAVNVAIQVYDGYHWVTVDTISFAAAGQAVRRYSHLAGYRLRFAVDAAVTITACVYAMT